MNVPGGIRDKMVFLMLARSECRQRPDSLPGFLFGQAKFITALQVELELCARVEVVPKTQGRIACDGPLSVQNFRDAIGRHLHLAGEFGGAHAELFQFFGQVFTWVDWGTCHFYPRFKTVPIDNRLSMFMIFLRNRYPLVKSSSSSDLGRNLKEQLSC